MADVFHRSRGGVKRPPRDMRAIRKALVWSTSLELCSILLVLGGYVGLSFLPYLALAFHFPALYLIDYWPAARQALIGPILVQWFVWFALFEFLLVLRHRLQRRRLENEKKDGTTGQF
jgi:sterol desaturase/sphingolipid hydroxylase (fatty acid hydroxylase superfamily)